MAKDSCMGDCLVRAFGLPHDQDGEVQKYLEGDGSPDFSWLQRLEDWSAARGYHFIRISIPSNLRELERLDKLIAIGESPRRTRHAVLCDTSGMMIYDPYDDENRPGLSRIDYFIAFER